MPQDQELAEYVEHYVVQLHRRSSWENAYDRLKEADPAIVPHLQRAVLAERNADIIVDLLDIMREYRLPQTLPFLADLLRHPNPDIWKAALDGIAWMALPESVEVLEAAIPEVDSTRREWFLEALDQVNELLHRKAED